MSSHDVRDDALRARAVDYVLGWLPAAEVAEYERHLAQCGVCRDEVRALRGLTATLSEPPTEGPARPDLWSRVEEQLGFDAPAAGRNEQHIGGIDFYFAREEDWKPAPLPGVETRILHIDRGRNRVTFEARLQPGASYPGHPHDGPEDCYVIAGTLWVGDVLMRAGDFQSLEAGTVHAEQRTDEGCHILLVGSSANSPLAWS